MPLAKQNPNLRPFHLHTRSPIFLGCQTQKELGWVEEKTGSPFFLFFFKMHAIYTQHYTFGGWLSCAQHDKCWAGQQNGRALNTGELICLVYYPTLTPLSQSRGQNIGVRKLGSCLLYCVVGAFLKVP